MIMVRKENISQKLCRIFKFDNEFSVERSTKNLRDAVTDVQKNAKPLEALIFEENFTVLSVTVTSMQKDITPIEDMVIGQGYKPNYVNHGVLYTMNVEPENSDIPIKTLVFHGTKGLPVVAGSRIAAKLPKYKERDGFGMKISEHMKQYYRERALTMEAPKMYYLERPYVDKEEPIEVALLSPEGKKLRTDYAIAD
jgi:hypothetical protein